MQNAAFMEQKYDPLSSVDVPKVLKFYFQNQNFTFQAECVPDFVVRVPDDEREVAERDVALQPVVRRSRTSSTFEQM